MKTDKTRRSGIAVMAKLIVLVKPLIPIMILAIVLGVIGFLCAIFLTIFASAELISLAGASCTNFTFPFQKIIFPFLIILAVLRGILHYGEQYCNHYIAFRILAIIRHKIFKALRHLCPAKLETRDKGNLISVITSDIELLEVFYAHTISPIVIAIIVSVIMCVFMGKLYVWAALYAACAYVIVGLMIPVINSKLGSEKGLTFRNAFGELNSFVLASLRGLDETIQFDYGTKRKNQINEKSIELGKMQNGLNLLEAFQRAFTTLVILLSGIGMFVLLFLAYRNGSIELPQLIIGTVTMMGSFGPVVALSNLSNNLNQTFASGNRVLDLLEEEPVVSEVTDGTDVDFAGAELEHVDFSYDKKKILSNFSAKFKKGKLIGVHGQSGTGKSTMLKLLMRFWDTDSGQIKISGQDIKNLNTKNLRNMEAYITQETYIFNGTIAQNISLETEPEHFTREQIIEAAKKASLHDFIISLPKGYDTKTGELGSMLSGGERQRIGLARAFLYDAPFMLLDEPTSNLDSLNEAVILKSLKDSAEGKTMVLVSHRKSTLASADYQIDL